MSLSNPPPATPAQIALLGSSIDSDESVIFRAESKTVVKGYRLPDDFQAGNYRGLLICYVVRAEGTDATDAVVSFWESRERFDLCTAEFHRNLSLSVTQQGLVAAVAAPKVAWSRRLGRWWRQPTNMFLMIATLAAVYGNLESIRNGYHQILDVPQCEIADASSRQHNVLVNAEETIVLKMLNPGRVPANLELGAVETAPAEGLNLAFAGAGLRKGAKIDSGQTGEVPFKITGTKADTYAVKAHAKASNDWGLGGNLTWDFIVRVWKPTDPGVPTWEVNPSGTHCVAKFRAQIGRKFERGLRASFQLTGAPGVKLSNNSFSAAPRRGSLTLYSPSGAGENYTAMLDWNSDGSVEPFTEQKFQVVLESVHSRDSAAWKNVIDKLELVFSAN
ncbi:hypothetical protein [Oleiharenicola lentus]|uniref:hypothetical protein n=1 Tax=Oleiharenicola lentus TaxID=2508720 RepID=UPI003F67C341